MSHMVIYRTADGQPGYHQTDALDDAVSFVERLRNSDGVDHARIFQMEEVSFDFKPYFRVEVGGDAALAAAPAPSAAPEPSPLSVPAFSAPAPPPPAPVAPMAPVEERTWMDLPLRDESAPDPVPAPETLLMAEPTMAESMMAEAPTFGEPEPTPPTIFEAVPPPPPPPALDTDESVGSANGMGARRGLFGR